MRKNLLILIVITLWGISLCGQERKQLFDYSDRSIFLLSGGYVSIQKTVDEGVSPLLYKGTGYGGNLGYRSEKEDRIWEIQGFIGMSNQNSTARNDMGQFTAYNIDVNMKYMRNLAPGMEFPLDIYGGLDIIQSNRVRGNMQMYNASFGYDIMSGAGLATHISKTINIKGFDIGLFKWKIKYKPHKISLEHEFDLPLLFVYLRPTYVVIENFVDGRNENINPERMKSAYPGKMLYLQSNTGINYHLRNNNIIRLGYIWQYYKISPEYSPVQGAQHLLQLIFKFKLNVTSNE